MKRPRGGSTLKQVAYARRLFSGDGKTKKDIARSVGYSPAMAANAFRKIENSEGFHNAMIKLAGESNNLLLAVMEEYKARGLKDFSNKDLNAAMNAISGGWDRIAKQRAPNKNQDPEHNPLRKIFMQKVASQTINITPESSVVEVPSTPVEDQPQPPEEEVDLDF